MLFRGQGVKEMEDIKLRPSGDRQKKKQLSAGELWG